MNKGFENCIIPKIFSDKFTGCLDCKYGNDSEAMCMLRGCMHAVKLKECFERKRSEGKWVTITELGQQEVCSNCGEKLDKGAIFCSSCGTKVE